MKKETEIKVGQVWVSKLGNLPVKILEVNAHRVRFGWWVFWCFESDNYCVNDFKVCYNLVADSMREEDFKQWCKTGKNPTLKSETEIKVGQVWVSKLGNLPVKILEVNAHRVRFGWWVFWCFESDNYCVNDFKVCYNLVADSMREEDFKQWCKTGKRR